MFTFIICKYLTPQIEDHTGKGLMAIFGMVGDLLLLLCIVEALTEILAKV